VAAVVAVHRRVHSQGAGAWRLAKPCSAESNWPIPILRRSSRNPETKFQDLLLAFAVARLFPEVKSNALEPGWVPTKRGGVTSHPTQVWLAASDEPAAAVSGRYFFHQKQRDPDLDATDIERQDSLLDLGRKVSGIAPITP
jgi:hypothetical protein